MLLSTYAFCQMPDTTGLYGAREDKIEAAVKKGIRGSGGISKLSEIRTETITADGLCKMACCNLAESFENSASVSVGYSDAVTGARQIRLLGQSGIYTQMLDENRPVMRGLSAPWGLTFIPGQWLNSIQIAKGVTSVINGVESMTGQINMEHRKPTDEIPLYLQLSAMSDTKTDLNFASSLQLDPMEKWSTVILGHIDGNFASFDHNGDGFMDDPRQMNFALANRWLYYSMDGVQIRFGVKALQDKRYGGQMAVDGWRSNILNRSLGGYIKAGIPLNADNTINIATIADYTWQGLQSSFGQRNYDAGQHSAFANVIYQDHRLEQHQISFGISEMLDVYDESCWGGKGTATLSDLGLYGEYTFHTADRKKFSGILGLRGDWYNTEGVKFSPRLTLKWTPADQLVFRANGGRGLRYSSAITDNIGILSTGKNISGDFMNHTLEDSWTFGGNITWYLPYDKKGKTYLSADYFYTGFTRQMVVDYVNSTDITFTDSATNLGAGAYTHNVQLDFSTEIINGLTLTLTGRYSDARQPLKGCQSGEKPLVSKYKAVLNIQYATNLNKWIFDFTASVNGPCRVWDFMQSDYENGYTQTYPLLYAQVTRRFKRFDVYIGGENLTNYKQENPIIRANDPFSREFDASCIWGPLSGIKGYLGMRFTLEHEHHHHH